ARSHRSHARTAKGRVPHLSRFAVRAVPAVPAGRRPAAGDRQAGGGRAGRRGLPDAAGRHGVGQDFYDGERDRPPGP
ncbi:MAG: Excinuclease ABC subunit B, partial [uncultured Ramlibacter sp.]